MFRFCEEYIGDAYKVCEHYKKAGDAISVVMVATKDFRVPSACDSGVGYAVRLSRQRKPIVDCVYLTKEKPKNKKHKRGSLFSIKLGEGIEEARRSQGLTLADVSERTGLTMNAIASIESGRYNLDCRLLGVLLDSLGYEIELKRAQSQDYE